MPGCSSSPVSHSTPATISGPSSAPNWSIASCTAKPLPRPVAEVACDSRVSFAGARTALPTRSRITSPQATHSAEASPRVGTLTTVMSVAGDRPLPEPPAPVRRRPRHQPQQERRGLPDAGDDADDERGRAEVGQQRPGDRAGALVQDVAEQRDEPEPDDEPPRRQRRSGGCIHVLQSRRHILTPT